MEDLVDMWRDGVEGKMVAALVCFCVLLVATVVIGVPVGIYETVAANRLERRCLAAGWPEASWRWIGPDYCGRMVNQTYIVAPADSVAP